MADGSLKSAPPALADALKAVGKPPIDTDHRKQKNEAEMGPKPLSGTEPILIHDALPMGKEAKEVIPQLKDEHNVGQGIRFKSLKRNNTDKPKSQEKEREVTSRSKKRAKPGSTSDPPKPRRSRSR